MKYFLLLVILINSLLTNGQNKRPRESGIIIGILKPGGNNAITDVPGVRVGHVTIMEGDSVRTGVTAILPHDGNIFQEKVPAGIFIGNGFGKLAGYPQVEELGTIETPIILTNTLSIPVAAEALIDYTFQFPENRNVRSVNPVVGETNDGMLNDIRNRHVTKEQVLQAIKNAAGGAVAEGNAGAGAGTVCFGFKGGIGTASRILPVSEGSYTVGVLVQTNFGGILEINGVPVGRELGRYRFKNANKEYEKEDGSCMIVIMTDAPLSPVDLKRLAARSLYGMARTGSTGSNSSGDFAIAVSTAPELKVSYLSEDRFYIAKYLRSDRLDMLFEAVIEATEEAIINSLFAAESVTGRGGIKVDELPEEKVMEIMRKYNRIENNK